MFTIYIESFLLVAALSVDSFVASFGYGTNKVKIPFLSVMILALVSSGVLAVSLLAGSVIADLLPPWATKTICFIIIFLLGISSLFSSLFELYLRKRHLASKTFCFKVLDLTYALQISANDHALHITSNRTLSPQEAFALSLAVSLDGLAIGFGSALAGGGFVPAVLLSLLLGIAAVLSGNHLGMKVAARSTLNLSWLSGVLLLLLAFLKLY